MSVTRRLVEDGSVPDVRMLSALERAAGAYIEYGGRVVTMCALGQNRSGLLSALIVCLCRESGGAEAVRFVRSKVPEALTNLEFADWLASRWQSASG